MAIYIQYSARLSLSLLLQPIIINDVLDYEIYIVFDTTLIIHKPHFDGHISVFAIKVICLHSPSFLALDILSHFKFLKKK